MGVAVALIRYVSLGIWVYSIVSYGMGGSFTHFIEVLVGRSKKKYMIY